MDRPARGSETLALAIARQLKAQGVRRIFGIPGGGSSLALMEAAGRTGIDFVLTRTETAGAIMAAVTGELTGVPGVMLTGIGPGAASAVNGISYASLEKSPVILFTDGPASTPHQALDQNALYAPITKMQGRLRAEDGAEVLSKAIEMALTPPWGPVQLDITSGDATASVVALQFEEFTVPTRSPESAGIETADGLLAASRRPVIIAGLEARHGDAPAGLRKLAHALACPVLLGLKASGVLPASNAGYVGLFTGAVAEAELIKSADLIILYGFDAIEIIPGEWSYDCRVLELCPAEATRLPVEPDCRVIGSLAEIADALLAGSRGSDWQGAEIAKSRRDIAKKFALRGGGVTAQSVMESVADLAPAGTRLTCDAGAHMFAALAFWPAQEPFGVLKSDGLSTMGYALPAAIASALEEPERPVLAVTGDGGMMMCLAELTTAVERGCNIAVVVINDAALSLIDIKQQRQQYQPRGVCYPGVNFAACAEALGCRSMRVNAETELSAALRDGFSAPGPALVDVVVNPDGYGDQLARIRG